MVLDGKCYKIDDRSKSFLDAKYIEDSTKSQHLSLGTGTSSHR